MRRNSINAEAIVIAQSNLSRSRSQEFERLSNELLVVLEDAAVFGVRVDPERRIWKATRQVVQLVVGAIRSSSPLATRTGW